MNDPRICIVGAGRLASLRIYPYIGAAGGRLAGVCDLDLAKAERNAGRFGGKAYTDLEEMLGAEKPDGVIVCVGPEAHAKLAMQILRLGYPVYTEKPPAATAADAWKVVQVARQTGLLCTTAFKKRHTVAADRARKWLDQFPAEDLLSLSVDYCSGAYTNADPRHSFLLDFAVHVIDLTRFLFGEVAEVFAFARGLDAYAVSLRFQNGAVGSLNLNDGRTFALPTEEIEITVKGGNFMTIHNSSVWKITEKGAASEWREPPTFISRGDSGRETGHLAEIEDFLMALQEKRITRSEIEEGYRTLVLYEAIAESAATGKVVKPKFRSDQSLNRDMAGNETRGGTSLPPARQSRLRPIFSTTLLKLPERTTVKKTRSRTAKGRGRIPRPTVPHVAVPAPFEREGLCFYQLQRLVGGRNLMRKTVA